MVGGNFVVGIVIFLILIVIQFVVITNGAGRVAEVAARFTLDAMPGKQMAIDADLNAGDHRRTRRRAKRREEVAKEADFYGAMDGASKFVKGDAIAGGDDHGHQHHRRPRDRRGPAGDELRRGAQHYTLLTVGDGLVSQIPALLISTATGIIVTRAAGESNLGQRR